MSTKQIGCKLPKLIIFRPEELKTVKKTLKDLQLGLNVDEIAHLPGRSYCIFYDTKDAEYETLKKTAVKNVSMVG